MDIAKVFNSNGIKPRHICSVLNVSRATASAWVNLRKEPGKISSDRAHLLACAVINAVEEKELPPPAEFTGRLRDKYIALVLRRYMLRDKDAIPNPL